MTRQCSACNLLPATLRHTRLKETTENLPMLTVIMVVLFNVLLQKQTELSSILMHEHVHCMRMCIHSFCHSAQR
jgi:hypothetical protein